MHATNHDERAARTSRCRAGRPHGRISFLAAAALLSGIAAAQVDAPSDGSGAMPAASSTRSGTPAPAPGRLDTTVVTAHYANGVGTSDAASQGTVTAKLIENRPTLRTGEIMEFIPGMIVSQHSGDGKASQYYLRGFNLDHGTDFATWVEGMPVNMRTHAHGQGYTDLNFLIPELIGRIDYRKGPYYADEGDFASAGAARIRLADRLPQGLASLSAGSYGYTRGVVANSVAAGAGTLLFGLDAEHNNGPWQIPENLHKAAAILRYSQGERFDGFALTAMGYDARWRSTDQIPQRAVDAGLIDRYGSLDPTDGGRTSRYSLSLDWAKRTANGLTQFNTYAVQSRLNLISNFTYLLDDPVAADQFEQTERRRVAGFDFSHAWTSKLGELEIGNRIGLQGRYDHLDPVGLYRATGGQRTGTTSESRVREASVAAYFESTVNWTDRLRTIAGVRTDRYRFDVASDIPDNTGRVTALITSPKFSLIAGPWARTELFLNYGEGFHSNDARGTTARVAPREGTLVDPVTPLVRTRGAEIGLRTQWIPGLESSLALWRLKLGSELVFSGDAGDTEASRASIRQGIEWNNHYVPRPWLLLDFDLALSRARFTQPDPAGQYVPGSVERVASIGVTVTEQGPWYGAVQWRYFGPRPLREDNAVRSRSTSIANLRLGYRFDARWRLTLDVLNVLDRRQSDIDYFYTSRLAGEPDAGVDDRHFHPVEPREFRVTLSARF